MRIQHNIPAMNSYRNYSNNTSMLSKNLEKLSSGYKINRAGDDAAGLAISEKMRIQITGLSKAQDNAKDGISLVQTAEGALQEVQDMLNRMYSLAEQSSNGTYDSNTDRGNLQKEVASLSAEIDRIADGANFNGIELLNGTQSKGSVTWTNAANSTSAAKIELEIAGNGEQLIGGSVTIGSKTFTFTGGASTKAGETSGNTIKMTKDTTAAEVVTLLNTAFGGSVTMDAKVNGASKATSMTWSLTTSGSKLTLTAGTVGILREVDRPMMKLNAGLSLQIGDTAESFNKLRVGIDDIHVSNLGIGSITVADQTNAQTAMDKIKAAQNIVSSNRGDLGALQNRLNHTINNLSVMEENIQDAESTIRDTDVADEMMAYTKNSILVQSAQAMLAQANQLPQGVLQLLQ